MVSELTWNTFRDHLILEYEVPKYDGDLGQPNVFVPVDSSARARKIEVLTTVFLSQRDKQWFSAATFEGLMRIRGVECASPTGYAEGLYARKLTPDVPARQPRRGSHVQCFARDRSSRAHGQLIRHRTLTPVGRFMRAWCADELAAIGIDFVPVQANMGLSRDAGTVRGLHYQIAPHLKRAGSLHPRLVFDLFVDLRPDHQPSAAGSVSS